MGVFEFDKFSKGTYAMANALADVTSSGGVTVIGGGDSVAAVEQSGLVSCLTLVQVAVQAWNYWREKFYLVDSLDDN